MNSKSSLGRRAAIGVGGAVAAALVLAGCASGGSTTTDSLDGVIVGTSDVITSLDPAGSYDNGSFAVMNQVYPFLLNTPYGSPDVKPDIATSASFTAPTEYTVKLKSGLKFANGDDLTSSDVKFTFDRQLAIADANGPSSLLSNLKSTAAPDPTTVVFTLKTANDQTWPQVLSSPAGPIVDEQVFSATKVTSDAAIVKGEGFAGQYSITQYKPKELIQYKAFDGYKGLLGTPKSKSVTAQYFTDETDLKLAVQKGDVDVAYRSLSPTDLASLKKDSNVTVHNGPGGEIRYIVFNFDTMPYGAKTADADAAKALAVRKAVADSVDRQALSEDVYKGSYTPLYSPVPDGLTGAITPFKTLYGDGDGGPDADKAKSTLKDAGISGKVTLNLQYTPDHYGASSDDEYALIKSQLEETGLFTVNLQSTLYDTYSTQRTKDAYPLYQLGWFPDYSDADNYLTPFFLPSPGSDGKDVPGGFLLNHYSDSKVNSLIEAQRSETDKATRTKDIQEIQTLEAGDISTLPLLQGAQVAVSGKDVKGVDDTLDASFKFRYAALSK
ncbi:peptide/nickel transport system substrate-binding protein [Frondihabitans sp. PhB188]|uniref:ABC transporter substrate-binding protein n=1 Tax=Frondihabitans sp. PhB188 TaxID=2485200 RepID=UPI000FBF3BCF|nr:ABC transporter substrate-binding protein [Frondihabitans sp. PhB188]ROQ41177.1 peptide/nickel transport system substrate-binding protein [Frondihabitans sp. PhB188]